MPSATVLAIKQCEPLVARMGDEDPKALAGAGRGGRLGLRHLLCRGTADCRFREVAGSGGDPLAAHGHVIVDRRPLLDLAVQFEASIARFVHARFVITIGHSGGQ